MIKHNRSLDGVRGIAILLVIYSHFNYSSFLKGSGQIYEAVLSRLVMLGTTGVDLFFILSGFLITTILLDNKNNEMSKYIKNFYARRFLRIFPLYYLCLALLFVVIPHYIAYDSGGKLILNKQLYVWLYLSNIPGINVNWDASSLFWIGHFWSLAVEEQFYLIWPFIIYYLSPKYIKITNITLIIISLLSTTLYHYNNSLAVFGWPTINRGGALCIGAIIAIYAYEKNTFKFINNNIKILSAGSFILLFAILFTPRTSVIYESAIYYASWLFYAICFIHIISLKKGILFRILNSRVLVFFGLISYGLYVYHGILRPLVNSYMEKMGEVYYSGYYLLDIIVYSLISLLIYTFISYISYSVYERNILKLKKYFQ